MTDSNVQPATVRLQLHPTDRTSIIPTYKMTGEMTVAGATTPITFSTAKIYTGHCMPDLNGMIDDASDARFKGAIIGGGLKNNRLTFELQGMAAGSTTKVDGQLQKGTNSDYATLQKACEVGASLDRTMSATKSEWSDPPQHSS